MSYADEHERLMRKPNLAAPTRRWFQRGEHLNMAEVRELKGEQIGLDLEFMMRRVELEMRANGYEPDGEAEVMIRVMQPGKARDPRLLPGYWDNLSGGGGK